MSTEDLADEAALADDLCAGSLHHSGGNGYHNVEKYGACSSHELAAGELASSSWLVTHDDRIRREALGAAEGRLHALAGREDYDPWARAIIGLDAVKAVRGESWPS